MKRPSRLLFGIVLSISCSHLVLVQLACGSACEEGETSCSGDSLATCNFRGGWDVGVACRSTNLPEGRCIERDEGRAFCSLAGAPVGECGGSSALTCWEGAIVACIDGHASPSDAQNNFVFRACASGECVDSGDAPPECVP